MKKIVDDVIPSFADHLSSPMFLPSNLLGIFSLLSNAVLIHHEQPTLKVDGVPFHQDFLDFVLELGSEGWVEKSDLPKAFVFEDVCFSRS